MLSLAIRSDTFESYCADLTCLRRYISNKCLSVVCLWMRGEIKSIKFYYFEFCSSISLNTLILHKYTIIVHQSKVYQLISRISDPIQVHSHVLKITVAVIIFAVSSPENVSCVRNFIAGSGIPRLIDHIV